MYQKRLTKYSFEKEEQIQAIYTLHLHHSSHTQKIVVKHNFTIIHLTHLIHIHLFLVVFHCQYTYFQMKLLSVVESHTAPNNTFLVKYFPRNRAKNSIDLVVLSKLPSKFSGISVKSFSHKYIFSG